MKGYSSMVLMLELMMFMKLVAGRLIEFGYYSLVNNEMVFNDKWCDNGVLCMVRDGHLGLNFIFIM